MRRTPKLIALAMSGALILAACGGGDSKDSAGATSAPAGGGDATTGADGVKMGPGVTADGITLGVMADLTGPFKELDTGIQAGHKMWIDEVNKKGGVCGRQIKLQTLDHGYKADTATIQFPDIEPKVAGFMEILGSPVIAALVQDINDKKVTTEAVSWASTLLDQPYITIVGTTYDLEMINALDYLMTTGKIKKGDKIGHIYIDGEYGGNGLLGSQYFAKQNGMTIVEGKVTATDADMTSTITKFKSEKVKAIALTTTPTQTASAASKNVALGLNVPMVGNNPSFAPALLDTPAAAALSKLTVAQSAVPYDSPLAKMKELRTAFTKANPNVKPNYGVGFGYAMGEIWGQTLVKACAAKDLTRDGIHTAITSISSLSTDKLVATLDYSKPGSPPSRSVYLMTPDKATPGGLKQLKALSESADAKTYKAPKEQ
jgi:ABC-type branched-subunit amino acid transport system substrate-binding protein